MLNGDVVPLAVRASLLLGCKDIVGGCKVFHRKHYPYADLPHGYQITQSPSPIALNGTFLSFPIRQIHLEQDTASSKATLTETEKETDFTLNLNRSNIPLLEIVTEPLVLKDFSEIDSLIVDPLKKLFFHLRKALISCAKLEDGNCRVDVNISLMADSQKQPPVVVELKNLNSTSLIKRSLVAEVERQQKATKAMATMKDDEYASMKDVFKNTTKTSKGSRDKVMYYMTPEYDLPPFVVEKEDILREGKVLEDLGFRVGGGVNSGDSGDSGDGCVYNSIVVEEEDHSEGFDGLGSKELRDVYQYFSDAIERKDAFKMFLKNDFKRYHNGNKDLSCFSDTFIDQFGGACQRWSYQDFRLEFKRISSKASQSNTATATATRCCWLNEAKDICAKEHIVSVGMLIAALRGRGVGFEKSKENLKTLSLLVGPQNVSN